MALAWGDLNGVRIDVIPGLRTRRWKVCRGHARESAVAHVPTASLNDLLSGPLAGRMTRGPDMHDFATGVMNDEKDIDCPEEDRPDAEEVAGPDFAGMRAKKIAPAWRWLSAMDASHVLRNGSGGDRDAQPCRLHLDPFLPGQEVLGRHANGMPGSRTDDPCRAIVAGDVFVAEPAATDGDIDFQPPTTPSA
jgi:hypothetical protein